MVVWISSFCVYEELLRIDKEEEKRQRGAVLHGMAVQDMDSWNGKCVRVLFLCLGDKQTRRIGADSELGSGVGWFLGRYKSFPEFSEFLSHHQQTQSPARYELQWQYKFWVGMISLRIAALHNV